MLRSSKEFMGYAIEANDGRIGQVKDLFFDDTAWKVRYVIADTGTWLPGRKVLISPESVKAPDGRSKSLQVFLSKEQIKKSPPVESNKPVSRLLESQLVEHFGWQPYWPATPLGNAGNSGSEDRSTASSSKALGATELLTLEKESEAARESALRSMEEVMGYNIKATDDEVGHLMDFIFETESWDIRYFVVDTRKWLPGGKKVLLSPAWIKAVDWADSRVDVELTKDQIKNSPVYDPHQPVNREYEVQLYDYYGQPKYW